MTFMPLASSSKSLLGPAWPACRCRCRLLPRRAVAELARLPTDEELKQRGYVIPVDDLAHPPYLPPLSDDVSIKGIPYPRGEVQTKPVFQWDTSLTEKENLRREKIHEKWRKRSPYATAELYAHHEPEPYAAGTKFGLMAAGVAFFLVILAYTNAGRLRSEAQRREAMGGTPPERPPRAPRAEIDAEGEAGDATLVAFPPTNVPALDKPPASSPVAPQAPRIPRDEATEMFLATLERGNKRLV